MSTSAPATHGGQPHGRSPELHGARIFPQLGKKRRVVANHPVAEESLRKPGRVLAGEARTELRFLFGQHQSVSFPSSYFCRNRASYQRTSREAVTSSNNPLVGRESQHFRRLMSK